MSVAIATLYQNLSLKAGKPLVLSPASNVIVGGANITFSLAPSTAIDTSSSNVNIHLFLISPSGLLTASFPVGDALVQTAFGANSIWFKFGSNYPYYPAMPMVKNALASGTLRFTSQIPTSSTSVGIWKVYAFLVVAPISIGTQTTLLGVTSFEVPQPSNVPEPLATAYDVFQFFATWAFIAGVAKFAIDQYPANWVRKNWPLVLGCVLMTIYLTLRFFLP